ncbi:MAG: ABC transporter ATP-binding protein [Candidatus Hermodarchaeota archaeon]
MGWIFEGIESQDQERNYSDWELIRRSIVRLYPYKKAVIVSTITMIIAALVGLATPVIFSLVIDSLENLENLEVASTILFLGGLSFLILTIFNWVVDYIVNMQFARLIPDFMVTLRGDIFDALQKQDMKFFDKHRSGQLNSRVSQDAGDYGGAVSIVLVLVGQVFTLVSIFVLLALIDLPLALVTSIVIPVLFVISFFFRRVARTLSMSFRRVHGEINSAMAESVNGIRVSKSFGIETESLEEFKKTNQKHYRAGLRQNFAMNAFFPTIEFVSVMGTIVVLLIGGQSTILALGLTTGTMYLFVSLLGRFFFPVTQLVNFYAQIQSGFAAYERILQVIDAEPEVKDLGTIDLDVIEGKIEFKNVHFAYVPDQAVLSNFSLTLNPGEKLAIVGHTGAGKTSIISILARFYEFQKGTILIDGVDIRDVKLKSYRQHVGLVLQKPFLFSGTVEDNIRYGRQEASEEDVLAALQCVKVDELIAYLNNGLQSSVGEGGSLLSTGTRQLISFARALLANPKILILDEATASVDAYTESIIQESLEELMKGRTSIVIAHRLSTIKNADRIIVLDHGKIIEEGTHEELLTKGGEYADLYETYFQHQEITWDPLVDTTKKLVEDVDTV